MKVSPRRADRASAGPEKRRTKFQSIQDPMVINILYNHESTGHILKKSGSGAKPEVGLLLS